MRGRRGAKGWLVKFPPVYFDSPFPMRQRKLTRTTATQKTNNNKRNPKRNKMKMMKDRKIQRREKN